MGTNAGKYVAVVGLTALAVGIAVVASAFALAPEPRSKESLIAAAATPSGPGSGGVGDEVWDGSVAFRLGRLACGTGDIGDQDSNLDPNGKYCIVGFSVRNHSQESVTLPRYSHAIASRHGKYGTWHHGMDEIEADDPMSPYSEPVPPGGGGSAGVIFELPNDFEPEVLYLHADESSAGAEIRLKDCRWNHFEGTVTGACWPRQQRVEVGVGYPSSIATYAGEGFSMLQVTCFNFLEWETTNFPHSPPPEGFIGHGVMTLLSKDEAEFRDNSGIVLELRPTEGNATDDRVCG